jgi:hypothetical protein
MSFKVRPFRTGATSYARRRSPRRHLGYGLCSPEAALQFEQLEARLVLSTVPMIGVNLDGISASSSTWTFNDAFLESSDWVSQAYDTVTGSESWGGGPAISLDANDWPTQLTQSVAANGDPIQQRVGTLMFRDINGNYPAGVYTAQWQGSGTVNFGFDAHVIQQGVNSDGSNYALLQVTPSSAGIYLEIAATNPANPVHNIHVWMPDANGQAQTGTVWAPGDSFSPFTPAFLAELKPFNTLRFMDWMDTNQSTVVDWADRRQLTYARQSTGTNGVSYEYMIELANELHENLWINLPYQSNANFNTQLATLLKTSLDPSLKVYVEWSNEVWNSQFGFNTFGWVTSQLALPQNSGMDRNQFIATQINQDFAIWSQVFASQSNELVRIVSGQAVASAGTDEILANLNGGYDAISTGAYITPTAAQTATFSASTTGDDVLNAAFADLPTTVADLQSYQALANKYSAILGRPITFVTYEGGQQFSAQGQTVSYQQAYYDAQVNPRIYNLYENLITEFAAMGGSLFMHYSNVSVNSKFGSYGALQYLSQPISQAPKYQALLDAASGAWVVSASNTSITNYHYDQSDTGVNSTETILSPANVTASTFGKLFTTAVDGQVYAQPLYVPSVNVTTGANQGIHNTVFVATEHDSVYAIDSNSGVILWQTSFINPAQNITTVPSSELNSADISPEVGITSTPVIDSTTSTIYVEAKTREVVGGVVHYVQRLHALDIHTGAEKFGGPATIGDTTYDGVNYTNATQVTVHGSGDGSVNGVIAFNALRELQRSALTLHNGVVYFAFASHGDTDPYHGWVVGYNATTLQLAAVFNDTPNGGEGGIWESGGGLSVDSQGNMYLSSGNGTFDTIFDANGFPINGDYGDSVIKLVVDPTTSAGNQNINGWGLKVVDYFTPSNQSFLQANDKDLGSTGIVLLPDSAGSAAHPHLLMVSSKQGTLYLLDRDNMGKYNPSGDQAVQEVAGVLISGLFGSPAYYNGTLYVVGLADFGKTFTISNGVISSSATSISSDRYNYPGSVPSISANGASNGIVWDLEIGTNQLRAYNAAGYNQEIYTSAQAANNRDQLGAVVKFSTPSIADGRVFVGTSNSLVIYGLLSTPTSPPPAPTQLSATTVSNTEVDLSWSALLGTEDGFDIEESTDGVNFVRVAIAPAHTLSYAVTNLQLSTTYTFRVRAFNTFGDSNYSPTAVASTGVASGLTSVNFPSGFASSSGLLTLNGAAAINGSALVLTNGALYQAASAFTSNVVSVATFSTQFNFQLLNAIADGFTFTIQNVGATALGGVGGNLGYGADGFAGGHPAIDNSVAIKFDLASNAGEGNNSTGLYINGATPTSQNSIDLTGSGIDLHSGHVFQAVMTYDGTTLKVTLTDTVTGATNTHSYQVSIGPSAYVGFTAGTGGMSATQQILNWTLTSGISVPTVPAAPTNLVATASGNQVNLVWTNNATNQTGFKIERKTGASGTYSQIGTGGASATSFTDTTVSGGFQYFYRIRATNAAGDSAYSNEANVTVVTLAVDFSSGFANAATALTLNGAAAVSGSALVLTNGGMYQTASAFTNNVVGVSTFSSQFSFQLLNPAADGFTFTIQNAGAMALGGVGGNLGYGADGFAGGHPAIGNSVAIKFDLANNAGEGNDSTGLYINGAAPTNQNSVDLTGSGVDLHSGHVISAALTYDGTTLKVILTDTVTGATATQNYQVSLGPTAYVGFTAGTGGLSATQEILSWTFSAGVSQPTVPAAPSNLAATVSSNQVHLAWTNNATNQTGFKIERKTGVNGTYSQIGTAVANATSFTDTTVSGGLQYFYRIRATNATGDSAYSNEASVQVGAAVVDFSSGFANAASALTLNGAAAVSGSALVLTNGGMYQTASAFTSNVVSVSTFSTQFSFQLLNASADGFTFTIQNAGVTALGGVGGNLGYGADGFAGGHPAIGNSIAVKFDLANNAGEGNDSTGLYVNGASPTNQNSIDLSASGIDLHSGHVFSAAMTYDGTTLKVVLTDTVTSATATQNYQVSMGPTAYVGFTAGTGGLSATQKILSWTFNSAINQPSVPAAPSNLAATVNNNQVNLAWANNATNQTGFTIERKTGANGTYSPIATVAANVTNWTDTSVVPGSFYVYHVFATNATGNSGFSNEASVSVAVDFSSGFANAGSALTLNGTSAVSGSALVLTNGGMYQTASAFTSNAVSVSTFSAQFSFQLLNASADGFTFTIQNAGVTALGGVGGNLGYGADGFAGGHPAIGNSVAVKFDLANNAGEGNDSTGLYLNGASPMNQNSIDLSASGIDLHSGHVFNAAIIYDGTTLKVTLTDSVTSATATQNYQVVSLGPTAYVGFTAGTGGLSATQKILSWKFSPGISA